MKPDPACPDAPPPPGAARSIEVAHTPFGELPVVSGRLSDGRWFAALAVLPTGHAPIVRRVGTGTDSVRALTSLERAMFEPPEEEGDPWPWPLPGEPVDQLIAVLIPPILVLVDGEDLTSQALAYNHRNVLLSSPDGTTRQVACQDVVRLE